jgi:hypothetical protein
MVVYDTCWPRTGGFWGGEKVAVAVAMKTQAILFVNDGTSLKGENGRAI